MTFGHHFGWNSSPRSGDNANSSTTSLPQPVQVFCVSAQWAHPSSGSASSPSGENPQAVVTGLNLGPQSGSRSLQNARLGSRGVRNLLRKLGPHSTGVASPLSTPYCAESACFRENPVRISRWCLQAQATTAQPRDLGAAMRVKLHETVIGPEHSFQEPLALSGLPAASVPEVPTQPHPESGLFHSMLRTVALPVSCA